MTQHFFHKIEKPKKKKQYFDFRMLEYANTGIYLLIPIGCALTLGLFLDNVLKTRPVLVTVFLFLGSFASVYNLVRIIKDARNGKYTTH